MEDRQVLAELYLRAIHARHHVWKYFQLLTYVSFSVIYFIVLYLQANAGEAHDHSAAHASLLPEGATKNSPFVFEDGFDDIYNWINRSFIQKVWADPVCGDDACDSPAEHAQFGRFGCSADCGVFNATTDVVISISNYFESLTEQTASSWNLCMSRPVGLCWYPVDQGFWALRYDNNKITLKIPDGDWTFKLTAPYGGVNGQITSTNGTEILRFGGCNETQEAFDNCRDTCLQIAECTLHICNNQSAPMAFVDCTNRCSRNINDVTEFGITSCTEQNLKKFVDLADLNCTSKGTTDSQERQSNQNNSSTGRPLFEAFQEHIDSCVRDVDETNWDLNLTNPYGNIWGNLAASSKLSEIRLRLAMQRAQEVWLKDPCLTVDFRNHHNASAMFDFLADYFGRTTKNRTFDQSTLTNLAKIHSNYKIGRDVFNLLNNILVASIISTSEVPESTEWDMYNWINYLRDLFITCKGYTCKPVKHYLLWGQNSQLSTTVTAGETVCWVYGDSYPHSIRVRSVSGEGAPSLEEVRAYLAGASGADYKVISRDLRCSRQTIGRSQFDTLLCALATKSELAGTFSYCIYFPPWLFKNTTIMTYESVANADSNGGTLTILPASPSPPPPPPSPPSHALSSQENSNMSWTTPGLLICSDTCFMSQLSNGLCDPGCNDYRCLYDGGDCACSKDANGMPKCPCPATQTRKEDGGCCVAAAIGENLEFPFLLREYGEDIDLTNKNFAPSISDPVFRRVAVHNRVLVGILLTQERSETDWNCNHSRTKKMVKSLTVCEYDKWNKTSWGIAAPCLTTSRLYNSTYAEEADKGKGSIPKGFDRVMVNGIDFGYSYIFDINLSNRVATDLLQYLADGIFFDMFTRSAHLQLLTFNLQTRTFTLVYVKMKFRLGGKISVFPHTDSVRLEFISTPKDKILLFVQVLVCLGILYFIVCEARALVRAHVQNGNFLTHFRSVWSYLDAASLAIMTTCQILWFGIIMWPSEFDPEVKYSLYGTDPGQYFELLENNEFPKALAVFSHVEEVIRYRSLYFALQGINTFFMVWCTLKLMDFQPRMGTITRTLEAASVDLLHFVIYFFIVFFGYAIYGHTVFGKSIEQFRDIGTSLDTMFNVLVGDASIDSYLLQLKGWDLITAVVFWWTYVFVVLFITLNLLVAIIVEAYENVKKADDGAPSIILEIWWILRSKVWRVLFSPYKTNAQIMRAFEALGVDPIETRIQPSINPPRIVKVNGKIYDEEALSHILNRQAIRQKDESPMDNFLSLLIELYGEHRVVLDAKTVKEKINELGSERTMMKNVKSEIFEIKEKIDRINDVEIQEINRKMDLILQHLLEASNRNET